MSDRRRRCPHPACGQIIQVHLFACPTHWRGLPAGLRRTILAAYTRYRRAPEVHADALLAAQDQAIAYWYQQRDRAAAREATGA